MQTPSEPLPEGSFACTDSQKGSRESQGLNFSNLFEQTIYSSKTKSEMAPNPGSQCSKQVFERKNIQNGDPRNNPNLFARREMGDIAGLQRRLFPHSNTQLVPEVSPVSLPEPNLPVPRSSLWPLKSSYGVHLRGPKRSS